LGSGRCNAAGAFKRIGIIGLDIVAYVRLAGVAITRGDMLVIMQMIAKQCDPSREIDVEALTIVDK